MPAHDGLLLVERYSTDRTGSMGVPAALLMKKYRGFDGIAWPGPILGEVRLEGGLASVSQLPQILAYYSKIADDAFIDLLYCGPSRTAPPDFTFVGFDLGYFLSEYCHFSIVLNEILFGSVPTLGHFSDRLNSNLLFDNVADCREALIAHDAAVRHHMDVERGDEPVEPIPIFALPRRPNS